MSCIHDIARLTGFSATTVARALNNSGYCKDKTKQIILDTAKSLNYTPNLMAKSLKSNKTRRVLFCIPDICNPFYFRMIQGASRVMEENDYYIMLYNTEKSLAKELKALNLLQQKYCDGIILISFDFCEKNIGALRRIGMPAVLGNRVLDIKPDDPFGYIYVDHIRGMELAAQHLLDKGCKNVLLMTGTLREQTSRERTEGYTRVLDRHNIPLNFDYIIDCSYTTDGAYKSFSEFMEKKLPVDGVIAANDLTAYGVLTYCHEKGIKIPDDIKLVSFDNTDYAVVSTPTLTSIDMCQYELGESMAKLLLDRILGNTNTENKTLTPTLIERESSK